MATNKDKGSSVKKTGGHKGDGKKFENRGRNDISSKFQRPVRSEMEVKVHAIMSEIAALNDQIKGHRDEISKVNDATKGARGEMDAAKAIMTGLQAERKVFMDQRQAIVAEREALKAAVEALKAYESKIRGDCKFKDLESCEKQIAEMEHRQSTTSLTLNEEKKLLKEVKALQDSKKCFSQLGGVRESMEKNKQSKVDIDKRYAETMALVDEVNGRMNKHRAVMDKLFGATSAQREHLPAIHKKIDELRSTIGDKRKEVQTLESEFKKAEDEYFKKIKEERKRIEEEKAAEIAARKAEKEAKLKEAAEAELRKVPFEDEIKLCESSIEYLDKKNKVYEAFMQLSQRTIPTAASSSSVSESALKSDGKVFKVMKREEPESKLFKVQEKKNKKKKSAMALGQPASANGVATGGTSDDSIVHDEMQAGIFTFLGVEAPSKIGEIGATVAALNTKKEYYRGQERNAPGVTTYAAFLKAQEKLAAKEAAKVQDSLVSEEPDVAPVKSKSRKEIVFTVDELTSVDLFPSLGLGETPESELTVA